MKPYKEGFINVLKEECLHRPQPLGRRNVFVRKYQDALGNFPFSLWCDDLQAQRDTLHHCVGLQILSGICDEYVLDGTLFKLIVSQTPCDPYIYISFWMSGVLTLPVKEQLAGSKWNDYIRHTCSILYESIVPYCFICSM